MNYLQIAFTGIAESVASGGVTLTTKGVEVSNGIAVGGVQEFTFKAGASPKDVETAVKAIAENSDCDAVGFWLNEGTLYVDGVQILEDEDEAIKLGRARKEIAIYNIGEQKEITL